MNISLPDEMKAWVEEQVRSGAYTGASDVVRDLIRRTMRRERGLARLQELVDEALMSGETIEITSKEQFMELVRPREAPTRVAAQS